MSDIQEPVALPQASEALETHLKHGKLVILTGTIFPQSRQNLQRFDPSKRRKDYESSLIWWRRSCERLGLDLLFAENSDPTLRDWVPEGIHSLYLPSTHESNFGKGRGEFDLIRKVLNMISNENIECQWIAKCTGRLIVRNIASIIPTINSENFVFGRLSRDLTSLDSRFVVASNMAWSHTLLVSEDQLDDSAGQFLEQLWARNLLDSISGGTTFLPFKRVPQYKGFSGTSDFKYHSLKRQIGVYFEDLANYAIEAGKRI